VLKPLEDELSVPTTVVDGTTVAGVEEALEQAQDRFGSVDGVANCIGSLLLKPAHLTTEIEWDMTLAVNLTSPFATVRAAA